MPRAIWTGSISFGLVNIPVKLFPATKDKDVHFHMLHDQDNVRLQRRMVCPADGQEVHAEHTVKGYEVGPDQYVRVQPSELEAIAPEKSRMIEILDFVDLADIDPVYFEKPYYLEPDKNAAKAYKLIVEAMEKTKKIGIAKFVMRTKEYLAALRPLEGVLCLETMHFGDEVTPPEELEGLPVQVSVEARELHAAEQLIENLSVTFDPERYKNEYRQRVLDLIDKKSRGETVTAPAVEKEASKPAGDLMAALQASLSRVGARSEGGKAPGPAREVKERSPRRGGGGEEGKGKAARKRGGKQT